MAVIENKKGNIGFHVGAWNSQHLGFSTFDYDRFVSSGKDTIIFAITKYRVRSCGKVRLLVELAESVSGIIYSSDMHRYNPATELHETANDAVAAAKAIYDSYEHKHDLKFGVIYR